MFLFCYIITFICLCFICLCALSTSIGQINWTGGQASRWRRSKQSQWPPKLLAETWCWKLKCGQVQELLISQVLRESLLRLLVVLCSEMYVKEVFFQSWFLGWGFQVKVVITWWYMYVGGCLLKVGFSLGLLECRHFRNWIEQPSSALHHHNTLCFQQWCNKQKTTN